MSVYQSTQRAIGAHFASTITQPLGLPTFWPNQGAIPPGAQLETTQWLRVSFIWSSNRPEVVQGTSGRYRTRGEMIVSVFAPSDTGADDSAETADFIVNAYRGLDLDGIAFETAEIRRAGLSGHWWQVNVHCPFYIDEVS